MRLQKYIIIEFVNKLDKLCTFSDQTYSKSRTLGAEVSISSKLVYNLEKPSPDCGTSDENTRMAYIKEGYIRSNDFVFS